MTKKIDVNNLQDETELTLDDATTVKGGSMANKIPESDTNRWYFDKFAKNHGYEQTLDSFSFPADDASKKDSQY